MPARERPVWRERGGRVDGSRTPQAHHSPDLFSRYGTLPLLVACIPRDCDLRTVSQSLPGGTGSNRF